MNTSVIIDTGPLVSFLCRGERDSKWVREQWKEISPPFLTCEAVLTEATFLLKRAGAEPDPLFTLLDRGVIQIGFRMEDHHSDLRVLMHRYRNLPMSLADASLVRMSEIYSESKILTLDSDFQVYRRHGNRMIPLIIPNKPR